MSPNGMARPRPAPTLLGCGCGGVTQSSRSLRCAHLRRRRKLSPPSGSTSVNRELPTGGRCDGSPSRLPCRSGNAAYWRGGVQAARRIHSAAERLLPACPTQPGGHKNDYPAAEPTAQAEQRPTTHFVASKEPQQIELLA